MTRPFFFILAFFFIFFD
ncbi:hypothetical protein ACFSMW_17435 [Virgibacillus halophilus]